MYVTHLYCSSCDRHYDPYQLYNLCHCGKPLLVAYDLDRAATTLTKEALRDRPPTLWRYAEVLPVRDPANRVTLGEDMTPLLKADRLGQHLGLRHLYLKDEAQNPTASFKARGMTTAVSTAGGCIPALTQLMEQGKLDRDKRMVLFNTGSGLKYLEAFND